MALVYDEIPAPFVGRRFDVANADATAFWLRHFENSLTLKFFLEKGTFAERVQASRELTICDRKLAYWKRHPNFSTGAAERGATALKNRWS